MRQLDCRMATVTVTRYELTTFRRCWGRDCCGRVSKLLAWHIPKQWTTYAPSEPIQLWVFPHEILLDGLVRLSLRSRAGLEREVAKLLVLAPGRGGAVGQIEIGISGGVIVTGLGVVVPGGGVPSGGRDGDSDGIGGRGVGIGNMYVGQIALVALVTSKLVIYVHVFAHRLVIVSIHRTSFWRC